MQQTGERFLPEMQGIIVNEHLSRYYFVLDQIDLQGKTVVDLASGEGYGTEILSRFSEKVYGFDISPEAISHAKKHYQKPNLNFVEADACNIPLDDNSVDVFISFETIEHHDRHHEMLSEIKRILKPDGILIMSSPDKKNYSDIPGFNNQYHVKELYYDEYKQLISIYFTNNFFFLQNNFSGSIIKADYKYGLFSCSLVMGQTQSKSDFTPLYNISISTDKKEFEPKIQQFHYGDYKVLSNDDLYLAQWEIRQTPEYKLGRKILKRLKFIRKFL